MIENKEELEAIFKQVIEDLKTMKRPQLKLEESDAVFLASYWEQSLSLIKNGTESAKEQLKMVLCVLDNTQSSFPNFDKLFQDTFNQIDDPDFIVFTLSAFQKQVMERMAKASERLNPEQLNTLKKILSHKSPEVLEWGLRTIEQLGSQALFFKQEILAAKPGMKSFFNQHLKASKQIIDMLEKRWKPPGKK